MIFESDAAVVVNCINDKSHIATIDPIIQDCKLLMQYFQNPVICHVRREANAAAHGLAQLCRL